MASALFSFIDSIGETFEGVVENVETVVGNVEKEVDSAVQQIDAGVDLDDVLEEIELAGTDETAFLAACKRLEGLAQSQTATILHGWVVEDRVVPVVCAALCRVESAKLAAGPLARTLNGMGQALDSTGTTPEELRAFHEQNFILSSRGDTLIFRDYRGDGVKATPDIFYRKIKANKESVPPIFNVDGINFIFIKRNGLYFVCVTKFNISPAFAVELLTRVSDLCKDYCGVLDEESIKSNFPLIYELLDEVLDFGYVQVTSTENLKAYVCNQPEVVTTTEEPLWQCTGRIVYGAEKMSLPSTAANKPVVLPKMGQRGNKREVFLDLLERLTVLIGTNGNILRSEIDGCIQMRNFVAGYPEVKIALSEDFFVGKSDVVSRVDSAAVRLDDCTFHESVDVSSFEATQTLVVSPPEGEFIVMKYHLSEAVQSTLPFTLIAFVDEGEDSKILEVVLKLRCNVPSSSCASNVVAKLPVPKSTDSVSHNVASGTQTGEFKSSEKAWYWNIKKLQGGSEISASVKVHMSEKRKSARKEVGPVSLEFEIPMHICSGLQIRYLRVQDREKAYSPFRWVRYITHSDSYVIRI